MNTSALAHAAYSATTAPTRTDRNTEYDVFARVTRKLKQASPEKSYSEFVAALHENRQLWTLLAVDVADANNALPQPLRAQIFYLAEFTMQQTSKIMAGDATKETLIEINTNIMRGLSQQGAAK